MRALGGIRDWLRHRPTVVDGFLAVVLAILLVTEDFFGDVEGPKLLLVAASLLMTLPLTWRRSRPLLVISLTMAAFAAIGLAIGGTDPDLQEPQLPLVPLLIASYSVGCYAPQREARIGLAVAIAGVLLNEPGDIIVQGSLYGAAWFAGRLVQARERDTRELRELAEQLEQARVDEARAAVAAERARIARDLHDVVAHGLSSIVLQAGAELVRLPAEASATSSALKSIEGTGRQSMAEMRRMVGLLRSADDEEPTPRPSLAHLEVLVDNARRMGIGVSLSIEGEPRALPPALDVNAFRIVQESVTNVIKHAGAAACASVLLHWHPRELEIEVADDGAGSGSTNHDGGGHGLAGLQERVMLFGGHFDAGPRAEGGFTVRAVLPTAVETAGEHA